jgi:hypothetical protein
VFGERRVPLTSIKGLIGHCMGAASALEAVSCVETIGTGIYPPTAGYVTADPECDVAVVANGMIADWAIHALADDGGRWITRPHLHIIATHRFWRAGTRTGQPNAAWLGTPRHRQRMMDAWEAIMGGPTLHEKI